MIIFSRRLGESIYLDNDIKIEVVRIGETRVKLAITAPDSVRVRREPAVTMDDAQSLSDYIRKRGAADDV